MYERLSKRVEKVIKDLAPAIAREYELDYVGTEHVLLAIEREGTGVGAQVLHEYGINGAQLKHAVDKLVRKSMEETWVFGRLPGTPHFRNVMATAIEQARGLESNEVCTEHLLLALAKEKDSVACTALRHLKLDYARVRAEVLRLTASAS
ncbi:MAG: Clp protease N-terminal domain-containing protein [Planctomycetota bacterium]